MQEPCNVFELKYKNMIIIKMINFTVQLHTTDLMFK